MNKEPTRINFSMTPLFMRDLMVAVELACEVDPTCKGALNRLNVIMRSAGYTEDTLGEAACEQIRDRLGGNFIIYDDE